MASVRKVITFHKVDNRCWKADNFLGGLEIYLDVIYDHNFGAPMELIYFMDP